MKLKTPLLFACLVFFSTLNMQAQRGTLITYGKLYEMNVGQIRTLLADFPPYLIDLALLNPDNTFVVEAYRLIYETIDAQGAPTVASGAVFLSSEPGEEAPLAAYMHGTITSDNEAPSRLGGQETLLGWILGADGYIAVLPDYLGLGDSPLFHPFTHAATEASASIDMILAAKQFLSMKYGLTGEKDLFLAGYSQGGHATMAVQREIEMNYTSDFNLVINVAGSGAYCLSSVQRKYLLDHPDYGRPAHIPYLILGYRSVYPFFDTDLDDIFVEPYLSMIPGLFDRQKTITEIEDMLQVDLWPEMLKRKFYVGLKYKYNHPMNIALRDNDEINWTPENKLRLLYCSGDEIVSPYNTVFAWLIFLLKQAPDVLALNLGDMGHNDCAIPALALTKVLFDCNSQINPCVLSLKKSTGLEQHMDELTYEEAVSLLYAYDLEDLEDPELRQLLTSIRETGSDGFSEIQVYPNPATDQFTVLMDLNTVIKEIRLVNMLGQKVRIYHHSGMIPEFTIQCEDLPPGIYMLQIEADKTYFRRVIIQ